MVIDLSLISIALLPCHATALSSALGTRTPLFFQLSHTVYFHITNIEKREQDVRMTTDGVRKSGRIDCRAPGLKRTDKKLHLAGGQPL